MKTKVALVLMFVLCLAMSAFAQDAMKKDDKMMKSDAKMSKTDSMNKALMDKERMAWKAIQDKRIDDFGKMLTDDYQGTSGDMVSDKNKELAEIRQLSFSNVMISDMKVIWADKNTAIVSSLVTTDAATPDGKTEPYKARTTTVWTKRGKDWMIVYHTDSPIK